MLLRWRSAAGAAALALSLALGGCAALWGKTALPAEPSRYAAAGAEQAGETALLEGELRPRAALEKLVTARHPLFGLVSRSVAPYQREWAVFDARLRNPSASRSVLIAPDAARLTVAGRAWTPLTAERARAAWPEYAAEDAETRADRAAAYERVLMTLLLPRRLAPGAAAEGVLAFLPPAGPGALAGKAELSLPFRVEGGASGALRLRLAHYGAR